MVQLDLGMVSISVIANHVQAQNSNAMTCIFHFIRDWINGSASHLVVGEQLQNSTSMSDAGYIKFGCMQHNLPDGT